MANKFRMTVDMMVTEAQALALQAMFECWTDYGHAGCSRQVGFFVDGDGNFNPNCNIKFYGDVRQLTPELRKLAIVKDNNGDRIYDYDPIAWKING